MWRAVELFSLLGFAIAAPLLVLFGPSPDVLLASEASLVDGVLWLLVLLAAPPAIAIGVELGLARVIGRTWSARLLTGVASCLVAWSAVASTSVGDSNTAMAGVGAAAAVVGAAVLSTAPGRDLVRLMAIYPLGVAVWFLATTAGGRVITQGPAQSLVGADELDAVPVVVLIVDEFPLFSILDADGDIDREMFPSFAALADEATWYPLARANAHLTLNSIPVITTGVIGEMEQEPTSSDHPDSLFTRLGGAGFELVVDEPSFTDMCPPDLCDGGTARPIAELFVDSGTVIASTLLPPIVSDRVSDLDQVVVDTRFPTDPGASLDIPSEALPVPHSADDAQNPKWVDDWSVWTELTRRAPAASFSYFHVTAPHSPWRTLPDGRTYPPTEETPGRNDQKRFVDLESARLTFRRHLLQVGAVDDMLGRTLERLSSGPRWDDTLFILTADHGAAFRGDINHRYSLGTADDEIFRIPFFVKFPGQDVGAVDLRSAETVDITPTIYDALGLDDAPASDGASLFGDPVDRPVHRHVKGEPEGVDQIDLEGLRELSRRIDAPHYESWDDVLAGDEVLVGGQPAWPDEDPVTTELDGSSFDIEVDEVEKLLGDHDPDGTRLPLLVAGEIALGEGVEVDAARFVVNGLSAGRVEVWENERYAGLIDLERLQAGANEVAIEILSGGERHLIPADT